MASKACLQAATTASSLFPSLAHAKVFLSLYLRVAWTSAFKQFLLFFRTTSFAKGTKKTRRYGSVYLGVNVLEKIERGLHVKMLDSAPFTVRPGNNNSRIL